MIFTKSDIYVISLIIGLLSFEVFLDLNDSFAWFAIVYVLVLFLIFIVWLIILAYNLATLAIDYAFPDEVYLKSGARQKRLIRSIILIISICAIILGTIYIVDFYPEKFLNQISWSVLGLIINILALRVSFLILGPDENPYYLYKQRS